MKINKGVEWAVHAAALMAALPEGDGLSADSLARYYEVPPAYMAKQLQALSRAGIVQSARGARGGYRLARSTSEITLLDIWLAIEGGGPVFRCSEIRQNGPCGFKRSDCKQPCSIAAAFHAAEAAFRDSLRAVSLSDIAQRITSSAPSGQMERVLNWISQERVIGSPS